MDKYEEIVNSLKEKLHIETLDLNSTLASLGLDSLDVLEFILDIEDNYGLKFDPSETQEIKVLGDLLNLIKSKC